MISLAYLKIRLTALAYLSGISSVHFIRLINSLEKVTKPLYATEGYMTSSRMFISEQNNFAYNAIKKNLSSAFPKLEERELFVKLLDYASQHETAHLENLCIGTGVTRQELIKQGVNHKSIEKIETYGREFTIFIADNFTALQQRLPNLKPLGGTDSVSLMGSVGSADISTWDFAAQPNLYGSSTDSVGAYTSTSRSVVNANSIIGQSENNDGIVIDKGTDFETSVSVRGTSSHLNGIVVTGIIVGGVTNLHGEGSQSGIKIDANAEIRNVYVEGADYYTNGDGDITIEGVGKIRGVDIEGPGDKPKNSVIKLAYNCSLNLTGKATEINGIGIVNRGTIDLGQKLSGYGGQANDLITGIASAAGGIGIYNSGYITMDKGNDTIDALTGGFGGMGEYQLGDGDDTVKGFGTGKFYGGSGSDSLYLPSGTYKVDRLGIVGQDYNIMSVATGQTMYIKNFENLYIGTNTWKFPIRDGVVAG